MKYYVASKYENKEDVREVMYAIVEHGHSITEDWTHSTETDGEKVALADKKGVEECDVFVGLFNINANYKGAYIEFGMAIALGKEIVIIGEHADRSTFIHLPGIKKFSTIQEFSLSLQPASS